MVALDRYRERTSASGRARFAEEFATGSGEAMSQLDPALTALFGRPRPGLEWWRFLSDLMAGYLAGFAWATFCALGMEAMRYISGRKPEA